MKLSVEIKVSRGYSDTPVEVELGESIAGGDFATEDGAFRIGDAVNRIGQEAIARALKQIDAQSVLEETKKPLEAVQS